MGWISQQLFKVLKEIVFKKVNNFFTKIAKEIKLYCEAQKAAKELKEEFQKQCGQMYYYNDLDKYLDNNNVIYTLIKECCDSDRVELLSMKDLARDCAEGFVLNYKKYKGEKDDVEIILYNLFIYTFRSLNKIEDEDLQRALNTIINVINAQVNELKRGQEKIIDTQEKILSAQEKMHEDINLQGDEIKNKQDQLIAGQRIMQDSINELIDSKEEMSFEELKDVLTQAFEYERKINPSVEDEKPAEILLPRGEVFKYETTATINKEESNVPLKKYFETTWRRSGRNHISVTGIGGIGKTVVLFDIIYPVPVIYVPLRNLSVAKEDAREEYITKYIREITLKSDKRAFDSLVKLCNTPWVNSPNVIILLDGINEVNQPKLDSIITEIRNQWSSKQGVQLILTSRYDISNRLRIGELSQVLIEPLSVDTIKMYLESRGIELPDKANRVWSVIDTPLMLRLYIESEKIRKNYYSELANWRRGINAGSIIWNYLQSELSKSDVHNKLEGIVAIHFIAPFICYKMMEENKFILSDSVFRKYIYEAVSKYEVLKNDNTLPEIISKAVAETATSEVNKEHFYSLFIKNFQLFSVRENSVQLMHQHFRDCLAAMYIIQTADIAKCIPDEWIKPFDSYVIEFISELLITEEDIHISERTWQKVWNFGYQKNENSNVFIQKMLFLYKKVYEMDISEINFGDVDLSNILLTPFRLTTISKNNFVNARMENSTFFGSGHAMTVCAVSWSCDDKFYMSASHDCTIRIYDSENNVGTMMNKYHSHYIRCAKCSPTDSTLIASAGDDKELVCWTYSQEKQEDGKIINKWIPKVWGECSNWIRGMAWDNDGKRIVCGDGNGDITLFDGNISLQFEYIHTGNVRHLAWSPFKKNILASGADDGTVCIWNDKGNCLDKLSMERAITSVAWLQNGSVLMIASSNEIVFYKIEYIEQGTKGISIQMQKGKEMKGAAISYVAVFGMDDIDYLAIFDSYNVEIINISKNFTIDVVGTYKYEDETNRVICAEWNSKGDALICGSRDGTVSRIDILKDEQDKERIFFNTIGRRCNKSARCSSWSSNGRWLAVGYDDCRIRIWDPFNEKCLAVLNGHSDSVKCLAWSPDCQKLVSGSDDNTVKIWEGKNITNFKPRTIKVHNAPVNTILWLKNDIIVSAGDDKVLVMTNTDGNEIRKPMEGHSQRVYGLAASPDEKFIISGGNDKLICLWDVKTGKCTKFESGHSEPIRAVAWSNDGKHIISASNDCTIKIKYYNSEKQTLEDGYEELPKMHDDFIYGANISLNGIYAIGGSTDSTVGFWRISDKTFIYKAEEHEDFVWNVSSSPEIEGKFYVATSSSDGTVKIWDVSGEEINGIKPTFNLPVIPESDIIGCDFKGAIIEDGNLKKLLVSNGALVSNMI